MAVMKLTGLQKTGQFVSAEMFGANAVFELLEDGIPSAAYQDAAGVFGVQNIRFGGGQSDKDPLKANAAGQLPVDGVSAINILKMPDGALRAELVNFLDWCQARTAAGQPMMATLVIPTKHLDPAAYAAQFDQIKTFAKLVMTDYADVVSAIQIGNEYWEMGETAYGQKADVAARALEMGMLEAGIAPADQPSILVQMGTAGNAGSEFPAVPGVRDFVARTKAANQQIIDQLSDGTRAAIDGVTEHYYYNADDYSFSGAGREVKNINRDYAVWEAAFDQPLELHITEWNVKVSAPEQHGMVSASSLIHQFTNMIDMGVDAASVWAIDYPSRTALTLPADRGARLDDQGRLTNSPAGAVFDMMAQALIGTELVETTFEGVPPGVAVSAFTSNQEMVFYISSRSTEAVALSLDLSDRLPAGSATGTKLSMNAETSNGKQWVHGDDAQSVEIDGGSYFYNEHDVDVILTDLVFEDTSEIDVMLNPFEVLELYLRLTSNPTTADPQVTDGGDPVTTPVDPPVVDDPTDPGPDDPTTPDPVTILTSDKHYILGTSVDDLILWTDNVVYIDGKDGSDTVIVDGLGTDARFKIDGLGKAVLSLDNFQTQVHLNNIERIAFNDGVLGADTEGNAGQAFRLYQASFNREPDEAGLQFWVEKLDNGELNLVEVADHFLQSDEFGKTYGDKDTLSDEAFLDLLYLNVLDRTPDAAGYAFWSDQQDKGLGADEMLVHFSESAENKAQVAPLINDGIWLA